MIGGYDVRPRNSFLAVCVKHFEGRIHEGFLIKEDYSTVSIKVPLEQNTRTYIKSCVEIEYLRGDIAHVTV